MNSDKKHKKQRLNSAITKYQSGNYQEAFSDLKNLLDEIYPQEEGLIKIYGQATYYLALCSMQGKKDREYTLKIANHLRDNKLYEDAWNIYRELTKDDEVKLIALVYMAECFKELIHKEELAFKIALELYSKKKYKESFDIFYKLSLSKNDEIKFLATCFIASYHISGYNNIKKDKELALNEIYNFDKKSGVSQQKSRPDLI
ncbi:10829_t:CDS:1 [Racocetra fulgida]|uniref:10829_t:CDS:1 n=1 Tax=Racocetra fulgida TaxID=60492 RepID=A0A9N8Z9Z7_9GLOM|nr:10829_t:CDS:1 [Racocetra fulgida]